MWHRESDGASDRNSSAAREISPTRCYRSWKWPENPRNADSRRHRSLGPTFRGGPREPRGVTVRFRSTLCREPGTRGTRGRCVKRTTYERMPSGREQQSHPQAIPLRKMPRAAFARVAFASFGLRSPVRRALVELLDNKRAAFRPTLVWEQTRHGATSRLAHSLTFRRSGIRGSRALDRGGHICTVLARRRCTRTRRGRRSS